MIYGFIYALKMFFLKMSTNPPLLSLTLCSCARCIELWLKYWSLVLIFPDT